MILLSLRYHLRPGFQPVKVVRPCLHHLPTFGKVGRPVVSSAVRIANGVGKLMLDKVGPNLQDFIQDGPGHGPEPVAAHFVLGKTHAPESGKHGIVAHRPQ